MATICQGKGRLRSNSQIRCPLPLAMSLPSFAGITRIDWEKSAKNLISDPKNGRHFKSSRSFEVKFADRFPLPIAMSLPSFVGINKIDWEKSAKMWFFSIQNGCHFAESRAFRPKFCTALQNKPIYMCGKYHRDLCKLMVLHVGSGQRLDNTFWSLLWRRRLQTNQKHIGPTLNIGSNDTVVHITSKYTRWLPKTVHALRWMGSGVEHFMFSMTTEYMYVMTFKMKLLHFGTIKLFM